MRADKHCTEWTPEEIADVFEVVKKIAIDDTGVSYEVCVGLRSFAAHAYEEGEDHLCLWSKRVDFGSADAFHAGGPAFVQAATQQDAIADKIASVVWGKGKPRP